MDLVKQELLKFFRSGYFWGVLALYIIGGIFLPLIRYQIWLGNAGGSVALFKEYAAPYEGCEVDFAADFTKVREIGSVNMRGKTLEEQRRHQLELDRAKVAYRFEMRNDSAISGVDNSNTYYNTPGITNIFDEIIGMSGMLIICCSMILLITAPVFSGEVVTGMTDVIASCEKGRSAIVKAKCVVAAILSITFATLYYWTSTVLYLSLFQEWDKLHIAAGSVTPGSNWGSRILLNTSVGNTVFLGYVCCFVEGLALVAVLCLVSALMRNLISSIGVCIAVIYVPEILIYLFPISTIFWSPSLSMQSSMLFMTPMYIDLFGFRLLPVVPSLLVAPFIAIVCFYLCNRVYCGRFELSKFRRFVNKR